MEIGPFGWLVVLLGVTAGLSASPRAASATPGHSRAALASKGKDGASPFRGERPGHAGGWPFGVEQTQDIVGGKPAGSGNPPVSKWPWIAMLRATLPDAETDTIICGGCLINSRHVLTAAHCMDAHRDSLFVRLGEFDTRTSTDGNHTDYQVEAILTYPNYRVGTSNHDIALLRLAKEVNLTSSVCTIPVPYEPTGDLAQAGLVFAGWGKTHDGAKEGSPVLQELNVTGVSEDSCYYQWSQEYPELATNDPVPRFPGGFRKEEKICTEKQSSYQGDCNGDSGGPLVKHGEFRVVGVLSTGHGDCGTVKVPTLYTRVSAYSGWIDRTASIPGTKIRQCQNTFIHAG